MPLEDYLNLLEYDYKKEHGHDRAKINTVSWHFHNYEHGYKHCSGSKQNPYDIKHHILKGKLIHIINNKKARGHGINRKPQWFVFNKEIKKGWFHLEKGIKKRA